MAGKITIKGKQAKRGKRMNKNAGWKLATTKGRKRSFDATLIGTINRGNVRLAIFSVPKRFSAN